MHINRRFFLKWSGTFIAASQLVGCSNGQEVRLYGGYRDYGNKFGVASIKANGELVWKLPTPARVHEVSLSEDLSLGAVVARRPGFFIQLFRPEDGHPLEQILAPDDLLFEGHALFRTNPEGSREIWATASPIATSEALLLKYDLDNPRQPVIYPLSGLGPHQIVRQGENLVIAIGGWKSEGRTVLNADSFESGLLFFHPQDASQKYVPVANKRLSARHLALNGSDIWVGMQLADPSPTEDALLYRYSEAEGWQAATAPMQSWRGFNGYIGSVAVGNGEVVATSPQGHNFGRWTLDGKAQSITASIDVAGATSIQDQWWLSSGLGEVHKAEKTLESHIFWDNHWVGHSV